MPFKSRAQQKYFHYLESQGKMPKKTVSEFDEATDFHDLPEHVNKMYDGGMIDDDDGISEDFDYSEGHASEYDSSGEPHTDDKLEDEEPMEYMSSGGMVKRMAKGAKMHNASFARALRKNY